MTDNDGPFYLAVADEENVFRAAVRLRLPVLLKGPTGCGKSRFVEKMAFVADRPLIVVSCNEDTSATDLLGRYLIKGAETVWVDGPVTRAARTGAFLYLDEIAEAREDVVVLLHSLSDHRRQLYIDKTNETVTAADGFQLVASFNPGYQNLKELKPSTRQRFATIRFDFPPEIEEARILEKETGCTPESARRWVQLAKRMRKTPDLSLKETVSTRLLVYAVKLMGAGILPRRAGEIAIVNVLTDEPDVARALQNVVDLSW